MVLPGVILPPWVLIGGSAGYVKVALTCSVDLPEQKMPLPVIPIIAALAAGGTLVPHAAGGMIVTAASGYVVGTYLSTAAIAGLLTTAAATLGTGVLLVSGAAASAVGSAGIFGTTIGATGITGVLMSVGILPATPVAVPILAGAVTVGCGYAGYRLFKLKRKLSAASDGAEAQFTDIEAKLIEQLIKRLGKKGKIEE